MSEKKLKHVTWFVDVPAGAKVNDEIIITSTGFTLIDQDGDRTDFHLKFYTNYRESGKMAAYLCSDDKDARFVPMKITMTLVNDHDGLLAGNFRFPDIVQKRKNSQEKWSKTGMSFYKLVTTEKILGYNKILLVVVISASEDQNDTEMDPNPNSANRFFALMTNTNPSNDVILQTSDGEQFKASISILSDNSVVFARMFANDMTEKSSGIVNVKDFSGAAMREFLRFICLGEIEQLEDIALELYEVAKVYQVDNLKKLCLKSLESQITKENITRSLEFADLHGESQLFDSCCINLACFYHGKKLLRFVEEHLNNELQNRVLKNVFSKLMGDDQTFSKVQTIVEDDSSDDL